MYHLSFILLLATPATRRSSTDGKCRLARHTKSRPLISPPLHPAMPPDPTTHRIAIRAAKEARAPNASGFVGPRSYSVPLLPSNLRFPMAKWVFEFENVRREPAGPTAPISSFVFFFFFLFVFSFFILPRETAYTLILFLSYLSSIFRLRLLRSSFA